MGQVAAAEHCGCDGAGQRDCAAYHIDKDAATYVLDEDHVRSALQSVPHKEGQRRMYHFIDTSDASNSIEKGKWVDVDDIKHSAPTAQEEPEGVGSISSVLVSSTPSAEVSNVVVVTAAPQNECEIDQVQRLSPSAKRKAGKGSIHTLPLYSSTTEGGITDSMKASFQQVTDGSPGLGYASDPEAGAPEPTDLEKTGGSDILETNSPSHYLDTIDECSEKNETDEETASASTARSDETVSMVCDVPEADSSSKRDCGSDGKRDCGSIAKASHVSDPAANTLTSSAEVESSVSEMASASNVEGAPDSVELALESAMSIWDTIDEIGKVAEVPAEPETHKETADDSKASNVSSAENGTAGTTECGSTTERTPSIDQKAASAAPEMEKMRFQVSLVKAPGERFGIVQMPMKDGSRSLIVMQLQPGSLVDRWNSDQRGIGKPEHEVRLGDRIVAVINPGSGFETDVEGMQKLLRRERVEFVVERLMPQESINVTLV